MEPCHARTERGGEERREGGPCRPARSTFLPLPSSQPGEAARPPPLSRAGCSPSLPPSYRRSLVRDFQTAPGSDPYFCFLGTEQRNLEEAPRALNINFNLWMRLPLVGKTDSLRALPFSRANAKIKPCILTINSKTIWVKVRTCYS